MTQDITNWLNDPKRKSSVDRGSSTSVVRLPGDASTRQYYRVKSALGTWILMKMETFQDLGDRLPFLAIQRHLATCGIDVPAVIDSDPAKGFILLEDLGDVTLLRDLQTVSNPDVERHIYQRVLDSLIQLQIEASPQARPIAQRPELDAFRLRFDHEKLFWELTNTIEHFYQSYLKRQIKSGDMKVLHDRFSEICTILAQEPTVLSHRDFHSRNIMVTPIESTALLSDAGDNRLVMIDFQDARLGPVQYDLASLLRDSYYQLEEAQISKLLDYYMVRWEALTSQKIDRERFLHVFDLMAVQRNFKAIGSFASFLNKRGDASYIKYIGNTFENIRRTLLKYPQYSDLREVLFHYYYF